MGILNCLKTDNETIAVTFRACDPSPLEEGSRDGYIAEMLSTRSCPMETRKKVISENGMRHWIRNNLVEILNATFLHDLTLDPWTGNQAIFTPGHWPATLKRCGVPRVHQAGIHQGSAGCLV